MAETTTMTRAMPETAVEEGTIITIMMTSLQAEIKEVSMVITLLEMIRDTRNRFFGRTGLDDSFCSLIVAQHRAIDAKTSI